MFFPRSAPSDVDPRRLAALRLSLNSPVVAVPELPPGPARAAIALWWEAEERPVLEVRLRSLDTGQRLVYGLEEALEGAADVERALEAGLNFAESMGFLFDGDVLCADDTADRARVREAWAEFSATGGLSGPGAGWEAEAEPEGPADAPAAAAETGAALLELTELAEPEPPRAAAAEPLPAAPPLSKFRGSLEAVSGAPGPGAPEPGGAASRPAGRVRAALGRVPLVRRRRSRAGREEPSLLLRILGAF